MGHTVEAMEAFIRLSHQLGSAQPDKAVRYRTYAVWAEGLRRSLEELDESLFAAGFFAERVEHTRWADLSPEEKTDYDRHVYFDKNAYIRMFSILDKLGTFLNDLLEMHTEKIKVRFSYFTVLRHLQESGRQSELAGQLAVVKQGHREAMNRLRVRRNMEIHYMSAELQDDLHASNATAVTDGNGNGGWLENLPANLADAQEGWDMVLGTLGHSFRYACERLRRMF